ncbi:hypothetical protein phiPsal1_022 [Pontimonas phage phiPsal1]|nr:hypothetical protein phiPsal1_022 [Pontimonas phage phiPsal1]
MTFLSLLVAVPEAGTIAVQKNLVVVVPVVSLTVKMFILRRVRLLLQLVRVGLNKAPQTLVTTAALLVLTRLKHLVVAVGPEIPVTTSHELAGRVVQVEAVVHNIQQTLVRVLPNMATTADKVLLVTVAVVAEALALLEVTRETLEYALVVLAVTAYS